MSRKLAELLLKDNIITADRFREAESAAQSGKSFIRHLIDARHVSEARLLQFLGQKFGLPAINLDKFEIKPEVIQLVPPDLVKKLRVIPIQMNQGVLVVAVADPTQLSELQSIRFQTKMNVEAVLTSYTAFDRAVTKYYGGAAHVGKIIESYRKETAREAAGPRPVTADAIELVEQIHDIEGRTDVADAPIIQLVNGILSEGITKMASDIHVEPYESNFRVRMRIDGILHEMTQIPNEMRRPVIARLKIMSRMDIAETRVPQDGRIKLRAAGQEIDFRVNTLPTLFGEKVVLRMLHKGALQLDLSKLGFEAGQAELFRKGIYSSNGMVLVTGPTGSGKTTTLYSALSELNSIRDNLSSVEDPVEYNLHGVNQVQVHRDIGLTFAGVLRALLRQDPDIILVGEIRDYETAEVAVQAALTGHLVLSTVHTNDAPSTIIRLMNMGLEPFLVTASINTIVAQRLMRTLCKKCRIEQKIPPEKLIEMGFLESEIGQFTPMIGKGCGACNNTGYKGRLAVYEIMDFSDSLKTMVLKGSTSIELKQAASEAGMQTLRRSALNKVIEGTTSLEEALANTMGM